ncbi:MAG: alpha-glucan family phosphorylase, partial [Chitinophagaceae bacterium]
FIHENRLQDRVVFLEDYDMHVAEQLVQGVDVWINMPRLPYEACGTSGMKVLVNGGLNVSTLDGWWAEAFTPEVGWKIGNNTTSCNDPEQDRRDAMDLYNILENEIIPAFYTRDQQNISPDWTNIMRNSMSILTPQYSANRSVIEYTQKYYLPAQQEYEKRRADSNSGQTLFKAKRTLESAWSEIAFGKCDVIQSESKIEFTAILIHEISICDLICVEIFADGAGSQSNDRFTMKLQSNNGKEHLYFISISDQRPYSDYTIRVLPQYGVHVPLEDSRILWQR